MKAEFDRKGALEIILENEEEYEKYGEWISKKRYETISGNVYCQPYFEEDEE